MGYDEPNLNCELNGMGSPEVMAVDMDTMQEPPHLCSKLKRVLQILREVTEPADPRRDEVRTIVRDVRHSLGVLRRQKHRLLSERQQQIQSSDSMATIERKLHRVLMLLELDGLELRVTKTPSGLLQAIVTSTSFTGMTQLRRQNWICGALDAAFEPQVRSRLLAIITVTPKELASIEAA